MEIKHVAFVSIILMCIAVSYYFFIALPNQNEARIALEKKKFDMEKQRTEQVQQEKQVQESQRKTLLFNCRAAAEGRANEYLRLNGTPVPGKPNVYSAPVHVHERVDQIYKDGLNDCQRMYGDLH